MLMPEVLSTTLEPGGTGSACSGSAGRLRNTASLMSSCSTAVLWDWVIFWVLEQPARAVINPMEMEPATKVLKKLIIVLIVLVGRYLKQARKPPSGTQHSPRISRQANA